MIGGIGTKFVREMIDGLSGHGRVFKGEKGLWEAHVWICLRVHSFIVVHVRVFDIVGLVEGVERPTVGN